MRKREESPVCEKILRMLESENLTAYDLECRCFIDVTNVRKYLKVLKHVSGKIRIVAWRRDALQGPFVPVWGAGSGEDAAKPSALTGRQRRKAYRSRPEVREAEAARKRAKRAQKKVLEQPYTLADMALGKSLMRR